MTTKTPKPRAINPTPMAFKFSQDAVLQHQQHVVTVVQWDQNALSLLQHMANTLRPHQLPIQDLRLRVQIEDNQVLRVDEKLGLGYQNPRLLYTKSNMKDALEAAHLAVGHWAEQALKPLDKVPDKAVQELRELARNGAALIAHVRTAPVYHWESQRLTRSTRTTHPHHYTDLADHVASKLVGKEVYPDAGPMRRVVAGTLNENPVELMTDPITLEIEGVKIRFSLGLEISTETYAGRPLPVVQINHKKYVWTKNPRPGRDTISGYFLPRGEMRALKFILDKDLNLQEDFTALRRAYGVKNTTARDIAMHGTSAGKGGHQMVITYRPGRGEDDAALRGIPVLDQKLSFERLTEILAPEGLTPWTAIEEIPTHYGEQNHADMPWQSLFEDGAEVDDDALEETVANAELEAWIHRVHSDIDQHYAGMHHIVLAHQDGLQQDAIKARRILLEVLGEKAKIVLLALPSEVHGPKRDLPGGELKPKERAAERTRAWEPFVAHLKEYMAEHPHPKLNGVVVMADQWYGRFHDDRINKRVARVTLNRELGLLVQYLLPVKIRRDGVVTQKAEQQFRFRTVNAWRDLAWKNLGKMNGLEEKFQRSFVSQTVPPRVPVLGFGIMRSNRKRNLGNNVSFIPYAIELDPTTGTCLGSLMLSRNDQEARRTPMMPLADLVRTLNDNGPSYLARRKLAKETNQERMRLTQLFIHQVLQERASEQPEMIVLFDASTLRGMWPWLNDTQLDPDAIFLNKEPNAKMDFANAALLRIRLNQAPKVIKDSPRTRILWNGEPRAGAVWSNADLYRLTDTEGPMKTYFSFGSRIVKQRRGISSYLEIENLTKKKEGIKRETIRPANDAWQTPNAIEVTVVCPGRYQPEELAKFTEALRSEYAHFGSWINHPGPLHFASFLKDYIPDYEFAEEEDEATDGLGMQPDLFSFDFS